MTNLASILVQHSTVHENAIYREAAFANPLATSRTYRPEDHSDKSSGYTRSEL